MIYPHFFQLSWNMDFDQKWFEFLTLGFFIAVALEAMIKHQLQLDNVTIPSWGNPKRAHTILFVPAASSIWFSIVFSHSVPPLQEHSLPYSNCRIFFDFRSNIFYVPSRIYLVFGSNGMNVPFVRT